MLCNSNFLRFMTYPKLIFYSSKFKDFKDELIQVKNRGYKL